MAPTVQQRNQHLLWRAGFGPMAGDLARLSSIDSAGLRASLYKGSSGAITALDTVDPSLKGLLGGMEEVSSVSKRGLSADEKKQFRRQSQQDIKQLNLAWLNEMTNGQAQMREKMALFWHGHFASRNQNIYYQQQLLDVIRRGALENFGDLLRNVSKSAAMLNFLNNNQNKKGHPNENFSREVMELFTIGRGQYSEQDVKEAARAFTGWGATFAGEFVFRRGQHDDGEKQVLGRSGHFDGDDVLNILLEQRQTAVFVTRKLYRWLVDEEIDEARVNWLAGRWYDRQYAIGPLLEDIFGSEWFYDPRHMGTRIKSPVELLVGIRRILPMQIENESVQLLVQRLLGQVLFYPPNVAGWPGGASWIDSSTLMFRLRLPEMIVQSDAIRLQPKDDDDQMMGMKEEDDRAAGRMGNDDSVVNRKEDRTREGAKTFASGGGGRMRKQDALAFRARIDWAAYLQQFEGVPDGKLTEAVSGLVLQTGSRISPEVLDKYVRGSSREDKIKALTIRLMSSPEFQLC